MFLVQHFLEESARRLPNKVALICGEDRLTYTEINQKANRLAAALVKMGIERQDRVAIFMDNCAEAVIALFGILKAGGIFTMLNATMKSRKLNYILKHSAAKVLISHQSRARIVEESTSEASDLKHIVWKLTNDKPSRLEALSRQNPGQTSHDWDAQVTMDNSRSVNELSQLLSKAAAPVDLDLATIIYTSGSTGEPKGVMCAHYNVVSAARSISSYLENVEDDIIMATLPLSFDYGLYQVLMAFLFGGAVVLEKSFAYPYRILERMVEERATGFPIVPTMAAILLQMEEISKLDLSRLRFITNTAAALPAAHIRRLQKVFSGTRIYSMYGLTECKRVSYMPPDELERRPDSVGIPIPNEEVWIVGGDGHKLGPNETGELVVRGSNVMQGYWNDPKESALRYKEGEGGRDRLLYTGDLFRRDEEGFLYFVARKDDMIKSKGERISPKEIEICLVDFEGVSEAAVIGVPDEILGQAIKAFVVPQREGELEAKALLQHCQKNLEPFMVPKYIEFLDEFPKLANGKIDKKKLKRLMESILLKAN